MWAMAQGPVPTPPLVMWHWELCLTSENCVSTLAYPPPPATPNAWGTEADS